VVGAGPGGAATAYHLARHGADVVLVDRATFPRDKVCGDGFTPRGVRALTRVGVDPAEAGFVRVTALRTYGSNGFVLDLPWPATASFPHLGVVRTRFDLDHLLVRQAVKAGVRFLEGTEATAPLLEDGWVVGARLGAGESVRVRQVVAADGAASRFAQQAGVARLPDRPVAAAARRYFRSPRPQEPVLESFLSLRDGRGLLAGYGWVFPVAGGLYNVGVGIMRSPKHSKNLTVRRAMDAFVRQLPPQWEMTEENAVGPLQSGPIPMGINREPLAVPGMLLVGDAGGLVNPFNGEGIAFAMESGELAAELILDSLARGRPAVAQMYPSVIRQRYARYYHIGRNWLKMLGNPTFMRLAVRYGIPRQRIMRFALRFLTSITDGRDGSGEDKLMHAIVSLAPER
jgi:geranylgeranyl reductase family protein